jgi:hypothetical protein
MRAGASMFVGLSPAIARRLFASMQSATSAINLSSRTWAFVPDMGGERIGRAWLMGCREGRLVKEALHREASSPIYDWHLSACRRSAAHDRSYANSLRNNSIQFLLYNEVAI